MAFYKQSTAYTRMFKMIDSADHISKKTGLTCTVNISKAGAAFGAAGGTVTEVANGWYKVALNTTDTNTLGDLAFYITATGADDTDFVDQVVVRDLADLAFPTTSGRSIDVTTTGEVGIDWANIGAPTTTVSLSGTTVGTASALGSGAITNASFAADTGKVTIRSNTAQTGAAGSITLDASASATTDFYVGLWVYLTGGTGAGQARLITAYNGTTKVATIAPNWATNPDNTSTFAILVAAQLTGIQGNVTGSVGSVTGAVGSVTGNVGGNVVGSTASVTAGVTVTTNNDKTGYALTAAYDAAKTAAQAGDTMKISAGTGAGQLDFTSGVVKSNLAQILGTALTETAGQIAAAFKQFFDVASPTGTMKAITNVVTTTNLTTNNDKTGYSLTAGQLFIKKNTALSKFMFLMTDSTTHAPKTGVTVTAQRSIDGGSFASCANSAVEVGNGIYYIDLAAADLNGTVITLRFTGTSSDDRLITIVTQT